MELVIGVGLFVAFLWWANKSADDESKRRMDERGLDKESSKHYRRRELQRNWAGASAIAGAFLGAFIGIAGFGGAIAGTIPGAILGAYVGYRLGSA